MSPLSLTVEIRDRTGSPREFWLWLIGELDSSTAIRLEERMHQFDPGEQLIVDLRGLDFLDSAGLTVLVEAKRARGEKLRLVGARPPVQHVFETAGVSELLNG
jgi:anti-anti-sigma factor